MLYCYESNTIMKLILLSILFLLCKEHIWSQSKAPEMFLWQATINESEFNLAGSVHAGKKENSPLPDAYMKAYNQANVVILEVQDNTNTLQKMIFRYAKKDSLDEEQYLDKYLSNESKDKLSVLFKGKEDILTRYYHYEGWLLNMAVSGRRSVLLGFDPEFSVDMYFHDLAVKDNKKIIGLDKIETQLKLFEFDVPLETQVKILESVIQGAEKQAHTEQPLFDNYYNNNLEGFREAFLTSMNLENPQSRKVYDAVFASRNKSWVKKLIELSNNQPGTYFMLVGSGHFFGPDNVLELLEKEGYTIKPFMEREK